jgi:hypothetical protein
MGLGGNMVQGLGDQGARAGAIQNLKASGLNDPYTSKLMEQNMRAGSEAFVDQARVAQARYVGELVARFGATTSLGGASAIKSLYMPYLEKGNPAFVGEATGRKLDLPTMKWLFQGGERPAGLPAPHEGQTGAQQFAELKSDAEKTLKQFSSVDLLRAIDAQNSSDAQPVRITNTVELAQNIELVRKVGLQASARHTDPKDTTRGGATGHWGQ